MTNKQSYVHKGCTGKVCFLDSSDILFHFISCKVGRCTQPSFIHLNSQPYHSNTRWFTLILYDPCFKKNSLTSAIKWLATKKDLGPFKIDRAVVDSNRSVNLLFNIRKILCTYPRKRKDIRDLKMFQIGDLSSFLAGGLTCIRCGDLFVSWSGCREDQTPQSNLMNNSISIKFNLFKFTADPGDKGPHFCLTLDKITLRLITINLSRGTSR